MFRGVLTTWPGRLVAVALVVAVGGGALLASRANSQPPKQELRTQAVTKGSVTQSVAVSGSVAASGQTKLAFKTNGRVSALYVAVGQQVTAGQALATIDATDLQNALQQAQQNLKSAQLSYQKTVQSAGDAQRTLEQTQQSTQNDIATAQQNLAKLKTNYTTAKGNALSFGPTIYTDLGSFQGNLATLKTSVDVVLNDIDNAFRSGNLGLNEQNDVKSAQNSMNSAYSPLSSAQTLADSVLKPSIDDLQRALDNIGAAIAEFDAALATGSDTSRASADFQRAMSEYSLASSRLSGAIDSVNTPLGSIASNVSAAQASLNTANTRTDTNLAKTRTDLATVLTSVTSEQQLASATKSKISQAGTALQTVNDAVTGSIANAQANIDAAVLRAQQSVQSAQTAVANQPLNIATAQTNVDNAATAVQTAQANLDAATLTAPSSGVVASIASAVGENAASPLLVLANTSALVLHGTAGEADVAKLKLGLVANVTVDAVGSGTRMTGRITSLDPVATIQQGVPVYGVDVTIDLPNASVKPGMTGTANVIIASRQGVLVVPNLAIRSATGRRYVQILKDGEAVDTDVTFGIANDTVTEVTNGLAEGDLVVLPQSRSTATARPGGGFGGPQVIGR
ncbi:MAG: biotin/lipoyl-binding protein [Chloroflexi bacterium]|nr:MAG: biotin/lipoyl-binding protein [Chloroflexota bacterium]